MLKTRTSKRIRKTRHYVRRGMAWCSMAAVVCCSSSCRTQQGRTTVWDAPPARLVWPNPPELARIEYVGAITSTEFGRRSGLGSRISDFLFGRKSTEMLKPVAVAKNEDGLLAVADPSLPTVHFFDLKRGKYWGLKQKLAAQLQSPVGVAVDAKGNVYVSDSVKCEVFVFDHGKKLIRELGKGVLSRPTGLALSPNEDRLYVVDTIACQIVVFDLAGENVAVFGERGAEPGQFNFPTYVATTSDGNVCVSDSLNFRTQIFRPNGDLVTCFGQAGDGAGDFARPKGIGIDRSDRVYVVDAAFENVQVFDPDGTILLAFGAPGTGLGEFSLPCGLFLDPTNTIWVADSFNKRIQVFRLLEGRGE